jgi:hypothetical protein
LVKTILHNIDAIDKGLAAEFKAPMKRAKNCVTKSILGSLAAHQLVRIMKDGAQSGLHHCLLGSARSQSSRDKSNAFKPFCDEVAQ